MLLARLTSFTGPLEGETLHAVIPVKGDVPTICRGHTLHVHMGDTATPADCDNFLKQDELPTLRAVVSLIKVDTPDSLIIAHADFAFNVGVHAYANSSVLRLTNAGRLADGCNAMLYNPTDPSKMQWVTVGGRFVPGLVNRRHDEIDMCMKDL